jgi:hypothetical protein
MRDPPICGLSVLFFAHLGAAPAARMFGIPKRIFIQIRMKLGRSNARDHRIPMGATPGYE